ncbi:response regulator [Roseicella aquatilis]|uniref:Response regulator n=1 Tax=Roseicella aquatilis TaxID=2527868 RepID=A0A4R4DK40_9PROT|nr:response regulator [Roseicella aquatilis]TCZ60913.1 response regulator [Roseicella aquatilis]
MDVLVVDDEPMIRETVAESLHDDGLEVTEAVSAEEALEIAGTAGAPDVVVTDVNLGPGMDGLDLAEEVRRRWPAAGVVIMTGNPAYVGQRCFEANERFLTKPFGSARMVSAVRELMRRSGR